ncbi:MAG: hypothetical protein BWY70_00526 [Bacteroidetes bacterium ADurb.Bin408]|nr:MAG: hypothetical protein BWY70_00526 [Bacteroidetes bacterium ADurb.Bin408]
MKIINEYIYKHSFIIILIFFICVFLTIKFTWLGTDGKGYTRIIDSDGKGYYLYLPNIFLNNSISKQTIDNRYILNFNGAGANKYYIGTAIAMAPFFGLGYLGASIGGYERDGYSPPFQIAISIAGLIYLIIGLYFLKEFLKLYEVKKSIIAIVLIIIVFGTNLITYAIISPSMSHVYSWCFITAFLYNIKKLFIEKRIKNFRWGMVILGFIIILRPTNGIIILIIPFLAGTYYNLIKTFKFIFSLRNVIKGITLFLMVIFIQPFLWYIQTGSYFIQSYKNEGFNFLEPQIWNVLFSFRKGLFIYTPIILLSLLGLITLRKKKFELYSLVFFLIALTYLISSWWNWYYGPSFGQRTFVEFYGIGGLLIALLFKNTVKRLYNSVLIGISFLFVSLNLIQNYQYYLNILSAWDMNFMKYKYVFLKTSSSYIGCLGGNNDMVPYHNEMRLIYSNRDDFEKENLNTIVNYCKYDSISKSNVCDYTFREFNVELFIPVDSSFINQRCAYAELSIDRMELEYYSCTNALVVIEIANKEGQNYFYYTFPINEIPEKEIFVWKTYQYKIELPIIRNPDDVMIIYIWNKKIQSFYIDNFNIKYYRIS